MADSSYRLEFTPARPGPPAVVVKPSQCGTDSITAAGKAPPPLWDPDDKLVDAADRLLGLKQRP